MCELVGVEPQDTNENVSRGIERLTKLILQHELKKKLTTASSLSADPQQPTTKPVTSKPYYMTLHRIMCGRHSQNTTRVRSLDQDVPFAVEDGHLVGKNRANDIEKYALMNKPGLSFIMIKEYVCCTKGVRHPAEGGVVSSAGETLYLCSEILCNALNIVAGTSQNKSLYSRMEVKGSNKSPHLWVYRERRQLQSMIQSTTPSIAAYLENFLEYFHCTKEKDFIEVDGLLSQGKISRQYLEYLFVSYC